jgi:DNA-binding NarL/FixJ family response regulator
VAALRDGFRPHGVLLDWYLKETTAEPLIPEMRELAPDAFILIVSGWASEQSPERLAQMGVAGIHDKGLGAAALLERIESLLDAAPPC